MHHFLMSNQQCSIKIILKDFESENYNLSYTLHFIPYKMNTVISLISIIDN